MRANVGFVAILILAASCCTPVSAREGSPIPNVCAPPFDGPPFCDGPGKQTEPTKHPPAPAPSPAPAPAPSGTHASPWAALFGAK